MLCQAINGTEVQCSPKSVLKQEQPTMEACLAYVEEYATKFEPNYRSEMAKQGKLVSDYKMTTGCLTKEEANAYLFAWGYNKLM